MATSTSSFSDDGIAFAKTGERVRGRKRISHVTGVVKQCINPMSARQRSKTGKLK